MPKKHNTYPDWVPPSQRRQLESLPQKVREQILENSQAALKDPRIRHLISQSELSKLAGQFRERLVRGVVDGPSKHDSGEALDPEMVAQFLAWLTRREEDNLPWTVKKGLQWLGVKRVKRKPGRPAGRESDQNYFVEFRAWSLLIDRTNLWVWKKWLKKEQPRRWEIQLRSSLQGAKFSDPEIDAVIRAKTPRSLAIQLTANKFGVEYDTVQKAILRYGRTPTAPTRTKTH